MNTRYQVGQKYYFINIRFEANAPRIGNMYLPWCDKLHEIEIIELTCAEHHKVGDGYEGPESEKKYDGFIFKDEQSKRWLNQYPYASYSQTSTEGDYQVELENNESLDGRFEKVEIFLERIIRGEKRFEAENKTVEKKALSDFYDAIVKKLTEEHKVTVQKGPWKKRKLDGTTVIIAEITKVEIIPA